MSKITRRYFDNMISRDLFYLVTDGKSKLGAGVDRIVYPYSLDNELVIKFEVGTNYFQNVNEFTTWQSIKHTPASRWFAPVRMISQCGHVLLMKRTEPMHKSQLPNRVPSFMSDLKAENWGMLKGRPVCHDYGLHKLMEKGTKIKLIRADWT